MPRAVPVSEDYMYIVVAITFLTIAILAFAEVTAMAVVGHFQLEKQKLEALEEERREIFRIIFFRARFLYTTVRFLFFFDFYSLGLGPQRATWQCFVHTVKFGDRL